MMNRLPHRHDDDAGVAPWLCALVFAVICSAAVLRAGDGDITSEAYDQNHHHMPVVRTFAAAFPQVDLSDYSSATGPAWHLVLAGARVAGMDKTGLRLMAVFAGAALVWVCVSLSGRWTGATTAAALTAPLALSPYTLSGSIWITTDVPSTLCVASALAASLLGSTASAGFSAWLAVGIRQSAIWVTAPVAMLIARTAVLPHEGTAARVRAICVAVLPAALTLALMVWVWRGLTPPSFRAQHNHGINLAEPAVFLALCGCWGLPLAYGAITEMLRAPGRARAAAVAAGLALLVALMAVTTYSKPDGRWGGPIWSLVQLSPSFAGRSVVFVILAPLGAIAVTALHQRAVKCGNRAESLALLVALLGLMAANTANSQAWERYCDLPLLVLLPWMTALGVTGPGVEDRAGTIRAGALLLAGVQAALSVPMVLSPLLRG